MLTVVNTPSETMERRYISTVRSRFDHSLAPVDVPSLATSPLSIDLSQNWTNATVGIQSTTKPSGVANLNGPSLWYYKGEDVIYTGYTGWYSSFSGPSAEPPISIWTFKPDGAGSGTYSEVITPDASTLDTVVCTCLPFQAYDGNGSAWALGGFDESGHTGHTVPGITQFDMATQTFTNHSAAGYLNDSGAVVKGAMHFVPLFGPEGLLLMMRGSIIANASDTMISMDTISVFDPSNLEWWNQTTTGSAPAGRKHFCTAGVGSTNETYEM